MQVCRAADCESDIWFEIASPGQYTGEGQISRVERAGSFSVTRRVRWVEARVP